MEKRLSQKSLLAIVLVFFTTLAVRWIFYSWSNSVNLLFADQWDFYRPYFNGDSLWEIFRWQHGPHRQGLGGVTTFWVAGMTHWNTRWEALHVAGIQILTVALALGLKWRLTRQWTLWDCLIPLFFLSFSQYELPVLVANPAHSYWPNALMVLACHFMLIKNDLAKVISLSVLFFVLVHTGFGFIAAPVFLIYFMVEILQKKKFSLVGLAFTAISSGVFVFHHQFNSASPCDPNAVVSYSQYFHFFIQLFNRVFGNTRMNIWPYIIFGLFVLTSIAFVSSLKFRRISMDQKIMVVLIAYSLFLTVAVTKARACYAEPEPVRYVPFLLPALFAFIVFLQITFEKNGSKIILSLFAVLGLGFEMHGPDKIFEIKMWNARKMAWSECWLSHESISLCKKKTDFEPYPMSERILDRLKVLKARKLNLYSE